MESSAVIVIPTTGSPLLEQSLTSAVNQTWVHSRTLVVIDGPNFVQSSLNIINTVRQNNPNRVIDVLELPTNTGANGWYGHRIYAAIGFLVDEPWIFYLDQDNWYDTSHVKSQIQSCEKNHWSWSYSLRKICDPSGKYLLDDNCESLGLWPTFLDPNSHLVDTSSFCVSRDAVTKIGQAWYAGWGGDRQFYANISHFFPNYGCSGKYTLNYRLAGNPGSVTQDFFIQGNAIQEQKYPNKNWPWTK